MDGLTLLNQFHYFFFPPKPLRQEFTSIFIYNSWLGLVRSLNLLPRSMRQAQEIALDKNFLKGLRVTQVGLFRRCFHGFVSFKVKHD